MFAGGEDRVGAIDEVARLGARLLLQTAIEAQASAFLEQERYERAAASEDARVGMHNGYCPAAVIILSRRNDQACAQRDMC